jgi:hypothetical protein
MDGITDLFALLTTTLVLNIIDYRQYGELETSTPISQREEKEIELAQSDAWMLVEFLSGRIDLVEDGSEPISVEKAFVLYLSRHGCWVLWHLKNTRHVHLDEVRRRLSAADFFGKNCEARSILKGEVLKAWKGEPPDFFIPLNQVFKIGFPNDSEGNMKRKSLQNPTQQHLKRRKT